jgi:hypothetical protein
MINTGEKKIFVTTRDLSHLFRGAHKGHDDDAEMPHSAHAAIVIVPG